MCAPKYNTSELSDRVLVFDIMPDGWDTASICNSVSTAESTTEVSNMFNSVSFTTTRGKRSLEDSEEPNQKRVKENTEITAEQQDVNSPEITAQNESSIINQQESENCQQGAQLSDNETQGLINELAKINNQDESPPLQELPVCEKSVIQSFTKIQTQEPLRQHKINIHSLWLSVQSTYFRSLLHSSGMKETHDTEVHLKIPESEENAHLLLLQAMYHGEILYCKTVNELLAVLELADKYDVKFVFKICKLILQKRATTFEISTKIMHVIKVKHNMNDVEDLAETLELVLAKEFSPLDQNWETKKFTNLSKPSLKYLLGSNDLIVASENTVFHALMYWMEQNKLEADSLEEAENLLGVVRFKLVTFDYLYNVIKEHPVLSKMPKFNQLFLDGMIYHAAPSEQKGRMFLLGQPVQRKKSEKNVIMYTYLLTPQTYDACVGSKSNIKLGEFWACGYKMSVDMIHSTNFNGSSYYPQLTVHNLKWKSLVHLKFSIVNTETSTPAWQTETFKIESSCKKFPYINFGFSGSGSKLFAYVVPL